MLNKPRVKKPSVTKSGLIPRAVLEPLMSNEETPPPVKLPEQPDDGASTGIFPVITEGEDSSAARDDDDGHKAASV
jgi:hypothetical protein